MNLLLWAVTAAYAVQSVLYAWNGQYPLALVVGGYTVANCGLIWAASQ